MMDIRRSADRGQADHGWLQARHSFSFAGYRDPRFMGFGPLRVINEDRIAPSAGFPTHPHRNMEILTYVISGGIRHRDSTGGGGVIRPGDVQIMSAGRGISHSEFNASDADSVHLLQIWLTPSERETPPGYQQRRFDSSGPATLLASPDGRDGALPIRLDGDVWRIRLPEGQSVEHTVRRRRVWLQVVSGVLQVDGVLLHAGDGLAVVEQASISMSSVNEDTVEALLFDLP